MEEPAVAPTVPTPVSNDDQPFTAKPFAPLIGFLEVGESELTNKTQTLLNEIWEYLGEESKSDTIVERLHALRVLEGKLGPPRIGQTRIHKLHGYVQAQALVKKAETWRDSHLKDLS